MKSGFPLVDRTARNLHKLLFPQHAPTERELGFPSFGDRIRDRHRRWWAEEEFHPLKDLSPKVAGQDYMRRLGYRVPQVYDIYDGYDALPPLSDLPRRVVIKPDHGTTNNGVFLLEDGYDALTHEAMTRDTIVTRLTALRPDVIVVEELLQNYDGRPGAPYDFKVYVFGAQVVCILIIERNSLTDNARNRFWYATSDWSPMPFPLMNMPVATRALPSKPDCFEDMLVIASDVGGRLNCFLRIDMYATPNGAVFGEFTPTPHLGKGYSPQAEAALGGMWKGREGCDELPRGTAPDPPGNNAPCLALTARTGKRTVA